MNVFATDRSVSVRCVLILFHSGHLVGHYVANLQFVHKHDFEAPFSPGLGPLLLKIRPPFGPSSKILGSPSQLVKAKILLPLVYNYTTFRAMMSKDYPEIQHQFDPWHWIKVI